MKPIVPQVLALIQARLSERLSLRTLADATGIDEAHVSALFRQETGVSVREYVARLRMNRAARLIRRGQKVEAVSLEVGYRSKKNFYRQFRRRFGTTPACYRVAHLGRGGRAS